MLIVFTRWDFREKLSPISDVYSTPSQQVRPSQILGGSDGSKKFHPQESHRKILVVTDDICVT
jgi:hypothetical protein